MTPDMRQEQGPWKKNVYSVWRRVLAALVMVTAVASCSPGDKPEVTGATVPTEATTSTTLSVEQEVEQAYLKSWDVYAKAMRDLDETLLPQAFARETLATREDEVAALKAKGTPARMAAEHDISVEEVTATTARLRDVYINHSVLLDPQSGEPTEPDPQERYEVIVTLERLDGRWKVVFIERLV